MKHRLKKAQRIRAVQERLHHLAEWRLVQLDREKSDLDADQKALIAALNDDEHLQGLFIDATAKRLNTLARKSNLVAQARQAQNERLVEEGLRLKRSERMSARAERDYQDDRRKRGFDALLQALSGPDDASSP